MSGSGFAYELISSAAKYSRPRQTTPADQKLVDGAISQILNDLDNPDLNVEGLAAALNVHRSTLSRRFRKVTGKTVVGYIIDLRMRSAAHLLKYSMDSISDIARKCGYRDANYFSKQFKNKYKIRPSDLRN